MDCGCQINNAFATQRFRILMEVQRRECGVHSIEDFGNCHLWWVIMTRIWTIGLWLFVRPKVHCIFTFKSTLIPSRDFDRSWWTKWFRWRETSTSDGTSMQSSWCPRNGQSVDAIFRGGLLEGCGWTIIALFHGWITYGLGGRLVQTVHSRGEWRYHWSTMWRCCWMMEHRGKSQHKMLMINILSRRWAQWSRTFYII